MITFGQPALRHDDVARVEQALLEGIDKASHDVVVYSLEVRDLLLPLGNVGGKDAASGDFMEDFAPQLQNLGWRHQRSTGAGFCQHYVIFARLLCDMQRKAFTFSTVQTSEVTVTMTD